MNPPLLDSMPMTYLDLGKAQSCVLQEPPATNDVFSVMTWGVIWGTGHSVSVECTGNINVAEYIRIFQ